MRTAHESYQPRTFVGHPGDCSFIEAVGEPCWGPVRGSSKGLACEGHRRKAFEPAPVPPTEDEIEAQEAARRERERENDALMLEVATKYGYSFEELQAELTGSVWGPREWATWQENRWFRKYTHGRSNYPAHPFVQALSDTMLLMIHATLGEGAGLGRAPRRTEREVLRLGAHVTWQIQERGLRFPEPPYSLKLTAPKPPRHPLQIRGTADEVFAAKLAPLPDEHMAIAPSLLTDTELKVLLALAWQVADYSLLDAGVRQASISLWYDLRDAAKERGIPTDTLIESLAFPPLPSVQERPPDESGLQLKALGYWEVPHNPLSTLPRPEDYMDEGWDHEERDAVTAYLKAGKPHVRWMGWSTCRVCRKSNGSACFSDGTYVWPEGFAHYLAKHAVKPPQEFIDHALRERP